MRLEKSKPKHRKGLWSPDEDEKLRDYVLRHGHGNWSSVPIEIGLQRNGKSCRLRWINYLRPGLKRGTFSTNEEELILSLHGDLGNKWSQIAQKLPGRTDNEIKNHWHTHLSKRSSRTAAATTDQTVSQELINPWSINYVSSFPTVLTTSPKPISSYTSQSSSTYTNGFPKDDGMIRSSLPKLFFEEWLSLDCCQSNDNSFTPPLKFQLTNDFMGGYSSIDDDELLLEESGDGVITFPYWGLDDHSPPPGEFSNVGSSSDHGMCSGLFNQWYPA